MAKVVNRNARTNLWAVKVFEDCGRVKGDWVLRVIFKNKADADQLKADTMSDLHRSFPLVEPVVYHPTFREMDAYLSLGNEIR